MPENISVGTANIIGENIKNFLNPIKRLFTEKKTKIGTITDKWNKIAIKKIIILKDGLLLAT